jgi:hypothetical protein
MRRYGSLWLFVAQFAGHEISSNVRTKEKPRNHPENYGMHRHLAKNREADRYVEGHPGKREPASPVVVQKHEGSRKDGQQFRKLDPHRVVFKCDQLRK